MCISPLFSGLTLPNINLPDSRLLGSYLAGLIDGDGHFSKAFQLVIAFNELDASLAYFLKEKIGYGNVYRVKNKKALILVISKRKGLLKILNLINIFTDHNLVLLLSIIPTIYYIYVKYIYCIYYSIVHIIIGAF